MYNYFESLKTYERNEYLISNPTKKGCLESAKIDGKKEILRDSNNRALKIQDGNKIFLQSYDTLIIEVDTENQTIKKLWDGYSVTTLKHINTFLEEYTGALNTFNKKEWLAFNCMNY